MSEICDVCKAAEAEVDITVKSIKDGKEVEETKGFCPSCFTKFMRFFSAAAGIPLPDNFGDDDFFDDGEAA